MHVLLLVLVGLMVIVWPWREWHEFGIRPSMMMAILILVLLVYMIIHA